MLARSLNKVIADYLLLGRDNKALQFLDCERETMAISVVDLHEGRRHDFQEKWLKQMVNRKATLGDFDKFASVLAECTVSDAFFHNGVRSPIAKMIVTAAKPQSAALQDLESCLTALDDLGSPVNLQLTGRIESARMEVNATARSKQALEELTLRSPAPLGELPGLCIPNQQERNSTR